MKMLSFSLQPFLFFTVQLLPEAEPWCFVPSKVVITLALVHAKCTRNREIVVIRIRRV